MCKVLGRRTLYGPGACCQATGSRDFPFLVGVLPESCECLLFCCIYRKDLLPLKCPSGPRTPRVSVREQTAGGTADPRASGRAARRGRPPGEGRLPAGPEGHSLREGHGVLVSCGPPPAPTKGARWPGRSGADEGLAGGMWRPRGEWMMSSKSSLHQEISRKIHHREQFSEQREMGSSDGDR